MELIRRARIANRKEGETATNARLDKSVKKKNQIVLRDQLTKRSQAIFSYARCLWAEYYVWTWKGAVICCRDGEENTIPLNSLADVELLEKDLAARESDREDDSATSNYSDRATTTTENNQTDHSPKKSKRPPRKAAGTKNYNTRNNGTNNLGSYGFQRNMKMTSQRANN